jgi:hypothetical protein
MSKRSKTKHRVTISYKGHPNDFSDFIIYESLGVRSKCESGYDFASSTRDISRVFHTLSGLAEAIARIQRFDIKRICKATIEIETLVG